MTTGEKRCDWWSVLLGDDELFTDVQLPAHVTDQQFISLLQQVSHFLMKNSLFETKPLNYPWTGRRLYEDFCVATSRGEWGTVRKIQKLLLKHERSCDYN